MFDRPFSPRETSIFDGVLQLAAQGQDLRLLKVQDIATAAGMGKGTLYEYFRSKEEILLGTIFYVARQELEYLLTMLRDQGEEQTFRYIKEEVLQGKRFPWELEE